MFRDRNRTVDAHDAAHRVLICRGAAIADVLIEAREIELRGLGGIPGNGGVSVQIVLNQRAIGSRKEWIVDIEQQVAAHSSARREQRRVVLSLRLRERRMGLGIPALGIHAHVVVDLEVAEQRAVDPFLGERIVPRCAKSRPLPPKL